MYNAANAQSSADLDRNMNVDLTETDKDCGKSCLRKYDKVYKLYNSMEYNILDSFCDDEQIDKDAFAKHAMSKLEEQMGQDYAFAAKQAAKENRQ